MKLNILMLFFALAAGAGAQTRAKKRYKPDLAEIEALEAK
jgi:hypothetical protein